MMYEKDMGVDSDYVESGDYISIHLVLLYLILVLYGSWQEGGTMNPIACRYIFWVVYLGVQEYYQVYL